MFSHSHFRETKLILFFTTVLVLAFACLPLFADSVGFTYNTVDTDTSWGATADKSFEFGVVGVEADGQFQSGDLYRGKYHASVNFPLVSNLRGELFTDGLVKGQSLDGLGNINDYGFALKVPVKSVAFSVGVFGRATGPFAKNNAVDDLVPLGYNQSKLEALGLTDVYADPTGLSIKPDSSVGLLFSILFDYRDWKVEVSGLPEVTKSDNPVHQLLVEASTSVDLGGNFDLDFAVDVGIQTFNDTIEHERAFLITLGYNFN